MVPMPAGLEGYRGTTFVLEPALVSVRGSTYVLAHTISDCYKPVLNTCIKY